MRKEEQGEPLKTESEMRKILRRSISGMASDRRNGFYPYLLIGHKPRYLASEVIQACRERAANATKA